MSDKIGKLVGDAAKTAAEDAASDEAVGAISGKNGDSLRTAVNNVANSGVSSGVNALLKSPLGKVNNIPVVGNAVNAVTSRIAGNITNKALSQVHLGNSPTDATPQTNSLAGPLQARGPQTDDLDDEGIPDTERHQENLQRDAQNASRSQSNGSGGGGGGGGGQPRLSRLHVWTAADGYNNKEGRGLIRGKSFRVTEVMNECFEIVVEGTSEDFDVALDTIVDKGMALQADYEGRPSLVWAGMCAKVEQINAPEVQANINPAVSAMQASYRVTIVPALWRTKLRVNHRIFQHQTIPDIIKEILAEWQIDADWSKVTATYVKHEFRVQYGETDFAFISRLLEEAGISYFFKHAPVSGDISIKNVTTLCFADAPHATGELRQLPFRGNAQVLSAPNDDSIISATVAQHVVHGNHMVRDHDFMKVPDYFLKQDQQSQDGTDYEVYQYSPGAFWIDPGKTDEGEGKNRVTRELDSARDNSAGLVTARVLAELGQTKPLGVEHAAFHEMHMQSSATGNNLAFGQTVVRIRTAAADVGPGHLFTIGLDSNSEHGFIKPGEKYLVLRRHFEGATADRRAVQTLEAVPAKTPYRPPLRTSKPRIYGVQSAIVVGPNPHDEIHTDKYGRVQVRFPWDRETKKWKWDVNDPVAPSCWIRVSQAWAGGQGAGFGSLIIPRVGDEVLVGFFEGDPDRPVVVGRVFNETKQPPYPLPAQKTRTVFRTQTWSDSNVHLIRGYNEMSFEDTEEREEILIQAQKDFNTVIKNNENRDIGGGNESGSLHGGSKLPDGVRTTKILKRDLLNVGKLFQLNVGGAAGEGVGIKVLEDEAGQKSILLTTGKDGASILIGPKNIALNATGTICVHSGGMLHLSSHGNASGSSGSDIVIEKDDGDVHVRSGGSNKVLINCEPAQAVPVSINHYDPAQPPKKGKEIQWPWWPAQLPPEPPKPTRLIEAKIPGGGEQPEGSVDEEE